MIRVLFFFFLNRLTGFYFIRYVLHAVYLLMDFIFNYSFSLFVAMANSCSVFLISIYKYRNLQTQRPTTFQRKPLHPLISEQPKTKIHIYLFIYLHKNIVFYPAIMGCVSVYADINININRL